MDQEGAASLLLEYARYHGLARDYKLLEPNSVTVHLSIPGDDSEDLYDSEGVALVPQGVQLCVPEKLVIDGEARLLLASILRPPHEELNWEEAPLPFLNPRDLKLELPLLRTDHEVDLLRVRRQAPKASLGKLSFMLLPVDDEADEGLQWPQKYMSLPQEWISRCRKEKLEVACETLIWLQHILEPIHIQDDINELIWAELPDRRIVEPLTPPMSPMNPFRAIDIPATPERKLYPLLSDHTSPVVHLQKALDYSLLQRDALSSAINQTPLEYQTEARDGPTKATYHQISSPPLHLSAPQLKLEEPLTPMTVSRVHKDGSLSNMLVECVAQYQLSDDADILDISQAELESFFESTFGNVAAKGQQEAQNETVTAADMELRMTLPKLDLSTPVQPSHNEMSETGHMIETPELVKLGKQMKLHKLSCPFEQKLPWNPFPLPMLNDAMKETVEDDTTLVMLLHELRVENANDCESFSWKPEGLRFLDSRESDVDTLEPVNYASTNAWAGLLDRRITEMDIEEGQRAISSEPWANIGTDRPPRSGQPFLHTVKPHFTAEAAHVPLAGSPANNIFSATDELDRFIGLQAGLPPRKKRKTELSRTTESPQAVVTQAQMISRAPPISRLKQPSSLGLAKPHSNPTERVLPAQSQAIPTPDFPLPDTALPRPVIVSSALLASHRTLISTLKELSPNLVLVEREFSSVIQESSIMTSSCTFSTSSGEMTYEGDILISPRTALLITTPPKVKQKPLPGQGHLSSLRKSILSAASCSARLVILVSSDAHAMGSGDGIQNSTDSLDESDAIALSDLLGFCKALSPSTGRGLADIEVLSVAHSPSPRPPIADRLVTSKSLLSLKRHEAQHVLARWILALIALEDNAPPSHENVDAKPDYKLLADTTTWELFLRRAGLNAFAAQTILSELKAPEPDGAAAEEGYTRVREDNDAGMMTTNNKPQSSAEFGRERLDSCEHLHQEAEGLSKFVLMPHQERVQRFAGALGGVKVLERVGRAIDGPFRAR